MSRTRLALLTVTLMGLLLQLLSASGVTASEPTESERAFLDRHWHHPLAPNGQPPDGFSPIEADLAPQSCAGCHPLQHQDWRGSRHAAAMGPGVMGQFLDLLEPAEARHCQTCHAPLAEQLAELVGENGEVLANPAYVAELRGDGLICAACHVRQHQRFGPPPQNAVRESAGTEAVLAHGGFVAETAFTHSAFCATCHQFEADGFALNGKLLENTYQEWRQSTYAEQGIHCQNCHMPERRHLWKGIHDPEMVAQAVAISIELPETAPQIGGEFTATILIENVGAGHYFPTYVTPQIFVQAELLDAEGQPLEDSRRQAVIGRSVALDLSQEDYDTRIAPGTTRSIAYKVPLPADAASLRVSVEVHPDHFYVRFFAALLAQGTTGQGSAQIQQAYAEASSSAFSIFDRTLPLVTARPDDEG